MKARTSKKIESRLGKDFHKGSQVTIVKGAEVEKIYPGATVEVVGYSKTTASLSRGLM